MTEEMDTPIWDEMEPRWRKMMGLAATVATPGPAQTGRRPAKKATATTTNPRARTGAQKAVQATGGES